MIAAIGSLARISCPWNKDMFYGSKGVIRKTCPWRSQVTPADLTQSYHISPRTRFTGDYPSPVKHIFVNTSAAGCFAYQMISVVRMTSREVYHLFLRQAFKFLRKSLPCS